MRRVSPASAAVRAVCGGLLIVYLTAASQAEQIPLARYFPSEDLVVYVEFDGIDAHQDAWRKTAAYRVLNETTTGVMLETVVTQLLGRALASDPAPKVSGAEVVTVIKHAFRQGFAFGINRKGGKGKPSCIGLVLRGAAKGETRAIVGRLIASGDSPATKTETVVKPGGRKVTVIAEHAGQGIAWWVEKDDLAFSLVAPQGADAMIAALDGKQPNAVAHPTRVELLKPEGDFSPLGIAYFDSAALPELPPQAAALGLDRVKRIDYRWGFEGPALTTISRIIAPSPRSGVFALLDQPTFDVKALPPLPSGLAGFTVFSFQPGPFFDKVGDLAKATDPNAQAQFQMLAQMFEGMTGRKLREEFLGHLGPRMVVYSIPEKINAPTNPLIGFAQGLVHVSKTVLVMDVDDGEAYGKVLDDVTQKVNALIKQQANQPIQAPIPSFDILKGKDKGYVISVPPDVFPLPAGMRPTILVGKKHLVIGTTPAAARQALAVAEKGSVLPSDDPLSGALAHLPKNMTVLSVTDTRNSMLPDVVANLPGLVQLVGSGANPGMGFNQILRSALFPIQMPFNPPGENGFALKIDPDDIPAPDDIRPFLFPSVFAMSSDEQGFRFVSRESFPALNPTTIAPVAAVLLLPAVQAQRAATRRAQSVNNLKQMGLALHNFHSVNNHFPPVASRDKDGKPLLSWRVAILPFIEQNPLFNEFKLDEPWDSPHNKALIDKMPNVYAVPGAKAEPGQTFYRVFSGKRTLFDPALKEGVGLQQITDGTSNTIAVVEAKEAVPWTKPDGELPFDPDKKDADSLKALRDQLGGHFPNGFNVLISDGSVRFIKLSISPNVLQALITRDGGEVIDASSF